MAERLNRNPGRRDVQRRPDGTSGAPTARQAGLEKLAEELYPNIVQRTTGQMTQ